MKFARPINDSTPRVTGPYSLTHGGVDYGYPEGTPIYASANGTVTLAKAEETRQWLANTNTDPFRPSSGRRALRTADYGNFIKIDHGDAYETLYAHLRPASITVSKGGLVEAGQKIGEVGSTGNSSGNHLHWEVRKGGRTVDPAPLLDHAFTNYRDRGEVNHVSEKNISLPRETFEQLVFKSSKYDAFFDAGYSDIRVVSRRINELEREVQNLGESNRQLQDEIERLSNQTVTVIPNPENTTSPLVGSNQPVAQAPVVSEKPFWKSKTVIGNAAALVGLAIDYVSGSRLIDNPETAAAVIAGLNIVLRFLTNKPVKAGLRK